MLLVPPGNDPPLMLGDQTKWSGGNVHVTKKFRVYTVPTISVLIHCCCVMLTSYYPVQVCPKNLLHIRGTSKLLHKISFRFNSLFLLKR